MAHFVTRALAALAALPFIVAVAQASDAPPDRSALSYEDNVTINTACFPATKQGSGAFDKCVQGQLAALPAHPRPDATLVPASRLAAAARDCNYLRLVGVAGYNDCLRQETAAAAVRATAANN